MSIDAVLLLEAEPWRLRRMLAVQEMGRSTVRSLAAFQSFVRNPTPEGRVALNAVLACERALLDAIYARLRTPDDGGR